jgi:hypothetical protein
MRAVMTRVAVWTREGPVHKAAAIEIHSSVGLSFSLDSFLVLK